MDVRVSSQHRSPRPPETPPPSHLLSDEKLVELLVGRMHPQALASLRSALQQGHDSQQMSDGHWGIRELGEQRLPVDSILFTQKHGSEVFGRGPHQGYSLESLVDDLSAERVSMTHPRLKIKVFSWPGRGLVSVDNRRLYCFKRYQELLRARTSADAQVQVVADVFELPPGFASMARHSEFDRLLQHYNGGSGQWLKVRSASSGGKRSS